MRPLVSDYLAGGPTVNVAWLRLSPYSTSASFDSRVLDAGSVVNWNALTWNSGTPAGTSVALSVRTGNTPTPDGTWSAFSPVAASGNSISASSRYIQYHAALVGSVSAAPALEQVTASYTTP